LARVAGNGDFSDEILGAGREALLGRAAPAKSRAKKSRPKKSRYLGAALIGFFATVAFDVGRKLPKNVAEPAFSQMLCRAETLSKRRKDCKMPPKSVPWRKICAQSDILSVAARVKGTSGRFADVFEPMTGDVQAQVALASKAELRAAVENAKAAQVEWGATNPQRRARVMMKFLELAQRELRQARRSVGPRAWQDRSRRQGRHSARP